MIAAVGECAGRCLRRAIATGDRRTGAVEDAAHADRRSRRVAGKVRHHRQRAPGQRDDQAENPATTSITVRRFRDDDRRAQSGRNAPSDGWRWSARVSAAIRCRRCAGTARACAAGMSASTSVRARFIRRAGRCRSVRETSGSREEPRRASRDAASVLRRIWFRLRAFWK